MILFRGPHNHKGSQNVFFFTNSEKVKIGKNDKCTKTYELPKECVQNSGCSALKYHLFRPEKEMVPLQITSGTLASLLCINATGGG